MNDLFEIFTQFVEVYSRQSMRGFIAFQRNRGLSMSQMGTLLALRREGHCGVSHLAERLNVTTAAASQFLNKLVDEGLIERRENHLDRRAKKIALTPKGAQLVQESMRARQEWFRPLIDSLTPDEKAAVQEVLELLIEKAAFQPQAGRMHAG
jgi:MarR family transcriptional regulator for hemolysin